MSSTNKQNRLTGGPANSAIPALSVTKTRRVLIVEDDALLAMESEDALQEAGYAIVGIAARCGTALDLAATHHPDLVLMDVRLAGARDGVEAAVLIRQDHDIPSLFVTAQVEPDLALRAQPARPIGWLSKPFQRHQLVKAVDAAFENGA